MLLNFASSNQYFAYTHSHRGAMFGGADAKRDARQHQH